MKYLAIATMVLTAVLLSSCEEVPVTVPVAGGGPVSTDTIYKTVLLEDLTGVRCPNCPKGSAQIKDMIALFGTDNIIAVGIHGRFLAQPLTESKYDFRNDYSRALETEYGAFEGKPAAGINRIFFEEEFFLANADSDEWPIYADQELQVPARAVVDLEHTYNPTTRTVDAEVTIRAIDDIEGSVSLSIFFTQSGIIDKQESVGEVIEDYQHDHVLIGGMTAPLGDAVVASMTAGEEIMRSYSTTLEAEAGLWVAEDMDVIAFIHSSAAGSKEVFYATHAHVVE